MKHTDVVHLITTENIDQAVQSVLENQTPVQVKDTNVYVINQQTFDFIINHMSEEDLWHLRWLSASEKHAKQTTMNPKLYAQLQGLKRNG